MLARNPKRLTQEFYDHHPQVVAEALLGKTLARLQDDGNVLRGIVVEVESYLAEGDAASHSFRGIGKKNESMFLNSGTLYVYPIHSRHCMNVVTDCEGIGSAVLIRAVEPFEGHACMIRNRFGETKDSEVIKPTTLTQGPGRLCEAFQVDRHLDGTHLAQSQAIWLEEASKLSSAIAWSAKRSTRIGISRAKELPLRWFIDGNRFVSGCARDHSQGRNWSFQDPR